MKWPSSSGYAVSLPSFKLARPRAVPIQRRPSRAARSDRISLPGRGDPGCGCHGALPTPHAPSGPSRNGKDDAGEESIADLPCGVRVLTDVEDGVQGERTNLVPQE